MLTASSVLTDSSVSIDLARGEERPHMTAFLGAIEAGTAMTTDVVRFEVLAGDGPESSIRRLADAPDGCAEAVQQPRGDVAAAAEIHRTARRAGESVCSLNDCLIAAIAIREGVSVLHNDRDFDVIARHSALQVARA